MDANTIAPAGLQHVFDVLRVDPQDHGEIRRRLIGRVMIYEGCLDVLADYSGMLHVLKEGPMNADTAAKWEALKRNPYFEVVDRQSIHQGHRSDLIPEEKAESLGSGGETEHLAQEQQPEEVIDTHGQIATAQQRPPSVFEYHRHGMTQPHLLECNGGKVVMNGAELHAHEVERILENARLGLARIRYKPDARIALVAKMESVFEDLVKIEPHLEQALGHMRSAVKAGHMPKEALQSMTREIFRDPMVEGVGNKKAYADFLTRPRPGVHIALDGNGMKSINDTHGHAMGDQAIKAMGGAMRAAMDESVGRGNGKLFRNGGDEFSAHVPTHAHAAHFARTLRQKLDAIPALGGTHRLSVSMGFGSDPKSADLASYQAKAAKTAANYATGQAKTHAHSLIPGNEGAIPLDAQQLPVQAPTAAVKEAVAATGNPTVLPKPVVSAPAPSAPGSAPVLHPPR